MRGVAGDGATGRAGIPEAAASLSIRTLLSGVEIGPGVMLL